MCRLFREQNVYHRNVNNDAWHPFMTTNWIFQHSYDGYGEFDGIYLHLCNMEIFLNWAIGVNSSEPYFQKATVIIDVLETQRFFIREQTIDFEEPPRSERNRRDNDNNEEEDDDNENENDNDNDNEDEHEDDPRLVSIQIEYGV